MNFISIVYGVFLVSVLAIYWSVTELKWRIWVILIASISFYSTLQSHYIPLLLILIFCNYRLGLELGANTSPGGHTRDWLLSNEEWQFAQADWNKRRYKIMWLGIVLNVGLLFAFKYIQPLIGFFSQSSAGDSSNTFRLIAPLGISFFTFECIAYLVDIYRGAPATKNFVDFAAYKFFFTKLISGPITRYNTLEKQWNSLEFPTIDTWAEGLWLISRGAFKKALLADHLGIFVDLCFGNVQRAGSGDLWLATFAYGLQLYLDFSGYVDIARGSALLFGLTLPENFDSPYFCTNIADFWRRWHMTLGDWLRNYIYFPLGGSRQGLVRTCANLLIVMLIAGIWHGAAMGFVVWGVIHGLALVIHRLTDSISDRVEILEHFWQSAFGAVFAWFLTQFMVFTSWIWFRLPNLKDSSWAFSHLWGHAGDAQFTQKVYVEVLDMSQGQVGILLSALFSLMAISFAFNRLFKVQFNWPVKLLFVPLCLYAVWMLAPEGSLPYIYFDF